MDKTNVILVGMPAVGKSTAGVIIAKLTGRTFVDCDLVIQQNAGKLLRDIISERGVDGFIEYENDVLSRITAQNAVIATGGSAVYGERAMANLGAQGTVVWLDAPLSVLEGRLCDIKGRGVVAHHGMTVADIYAERLPLYEKFADVRVDCSDGDIEKTAAAVVAALANKK